MKEAIRDCTAISYFDRYPVIRSFGYNNEEETRSRGQKRRVRRDGEGGGGEKRREKNIYIYMTALSVWYLARDLIYIFFFLSYYATTPVYWLLQIAPIILPLTNDMRTMRNMGPPVAQACPLPSQ